MKPRFCDYVPFLAIVRKGCALFWESIVRVFDLKCKRRRYSSKSMLSSDFRKARVKVKFFDREYILRGAVGKMRIRCFLKD